MMTLTSRVNRLWLEGDGSDYLLPPYQVFANLDENSPAHLEFVYRMTRAQKNLTLSSYDFLKPTHLKVETEYVYCINNLGFRSCQPYEAAKKKNTFRIIAYGSYQTAGYGLNEDSIYTTLLADRLNKKFPLHDFQVWNAGRHSGTAIVGLSQLKKDIQLYHPDFVFFDYGFVDPTVVSDNVFPFVMHFARGENSFLKKCLLELNFLNGNSQLFFKIWTKFSLGHVHENIENFIRIGEQFLSTADAANVPVIVIKQPVAILKPKFYDQMLLKHKNAIFFDFTKIFSAKYKDFIAKPQPIHFWLNEVSQEDRQILGSNEYFQLENLKLDLWQINRDGHMLVAETLATAIEAYILQKKPFIK